MRAIRRIKAYFYTSVCFLSLMSFSIMLMPWASEAAIETNDMSVKIVGLLFWLLIVLGYGAFCLANSRRKKFWKKRFGRDIQKNYKPGFLCFFTNRIAEVFDIMMAIFLVITMIVAFTPWKNTFFFIALLALLIWTVNMHSLFNGRTYRITKYKKGEKTL